MSILDRFLSLVTWWNGATLNTRVYTSRHGVKVGEDDLGNVFYESRDAKRRWVIFNGEAEASRVNPDWHGWLHHTFKEPPTKDPLPQQPWQKPHVPNMTGTELAYAPKGSIRRTDVTPQSDYEAWRPE